MNWIKHTSGLLLPPNLSQGPALGWYGPQSGDCSCCEPPVTCEYFTDNFDRVDSTNLGTDWTETAGDWSIASNKLQVSIGSATCTHTGSYTDGTNTLVAQATVNGSASGDQVRVYVNNGTDYAQITYGATNSTLAVYAGGSLVESDTITGIPNNTPLKLRVCRLSSVIAATVYNATTSAEIKTVSGIAAAPTSDTCAVGTATLTGTATFDDFSISKHHDTDSACPDCGTCLQCVGDIPEEINIRFEGITEAGCGSCAVLVDAAGFVCTRKISYVWLSEYCFWEYVFPSAVCGVTKIWVWTEKATNRLRCWVVQGSSSAAIQFYRAHTNMDACDWSSAELAHETSDKTWWTGKCNAGNILPTASIKCYVTAL